MHQIRRIGALLFSFRQLLASQPQNLKTAGISVSPLEYVHDHMLGIVYYRFACVKSVVCTAWLQQVANRPLAKRPHPGTPVIIGPCPIERASLRYHPGKRP